MPHDAVLCGGVLRVARFVEVSDVVSVGIEQVEDSHFQLELLVMPASAQVEQIGVAGPGSCATVPAPMTVPTELGMSFSPLGTSR